MDTVLRATDSAGLLGIVPALAGFTPRRSLVLLPFRGKRTHGAMRLDLPRDGTDIDGYSRSAVAAIGRVSGTDAVAIIVYTDDPPASASDELLLPSADVVDALVAGIHDAHLRLVDALCVTPDGWAAYLDGETALHPLDGIPAAPPVPGLADVSGDQAAGAALPRVDFAEKERVGRALLEIDGATTCMGTRAAGKVNPQALEAVALLDDLPLLFESALDHPEMMSAHRTAALLWCLDRPALRDVALAQWATDLAGGIRAVDAQLSFSTAGLPIPAEIGTRLLGRGPAPDPDRLMLALTVVRGLAARAPRASRCGPLTLAAWLSWALGRSTHAAHHLAAAFDIDPEYGMARVVETTIELVVLPEWALQR